MARRARERLSADQARRVALAAQGFGRPRPVGRADRRHLRGLFDQVGVLQIDSVNVLVRSHYLPGWSRLGGYPRQLLDEAAYVRREVFEYWAHEASLVPVALYPLLRWRAERALAGREVWAGVARIAADRPEYVADVLARVSSDGPLAGSDLPSAGGRGGAWWGWTDAKKALEWLLWSGQVSVAGRRASFERLYDIPARVIPPAALAAPVPEPAAAQRALLLFAADRLGVATAGDLGDYFRLRSADTRARVDELVEDGELAPVAVEGWSRTAYVRPGLTVPRRISAAALISPFDSLVWERSRTRRLFDFDLRLELYTPVARRTFGYYVLPFLLGDRLVGRVDLKADRAAGVLRVLAAYVEPHADVGAARAALRAETAAMSAWLGLAGVVHHDRGTLVLGPAAG